MEAQERSADKAAQEMIEHMADAGQQNAWDRLEAQSPQCGFGKQRSEEHTSELQSR